MYGTRRTHASCNLQMRPSINFPLDNSTSTKNESSLSVLSQTWHKSGSCPKGTIPIRRIRRQELLRAASLEHFGREGPQTSSLVNTANDKSNPSVINVHSLPNHSVRAYQWIYLFIFFLGHRLHIVLNSLMDTSSVIIELHVFLYMLIKYWSIYYLIHYISCIISKYKK